MSERDSKKTEHQVLTDTQLDDPLSRAMTDAINEGRGFLSLYRVFDEFDPLASSVNEWPLNGVAQRARDIVGDRTLEEIRYAAMWAEWMVQQNLDQLKNGEGGDPFKYAAPRARFDLLPHILSDRMAAFSITKATDFPNATWPELFAVLALAYIGRWSTHRAVQSPIDAVMAATEAIDIAEQLKNKDDVLTRRAKHGGRSKDQRRYEPWRRLAVEFWREGSFDSYTDAARTFIDEFRDNMAAQSGLSRGRPVTTKSVAKWMSNGAKAINSPPT